MKKYYIIIFIITLFCSCDNSYNEFFYAKECINKQNIVVDSICFKKDTIVLPNTSYSGFTSIFQDKIYFLDQNFCWIYEFSQDLAITRRFCGQGRGPKEIPIKRCEGYTIDSTGRHIILGSTRDLYIIDSRATHQMYFRDEKTEFYKKIEEKTSSYSLDYNDIKIKYHNNRFFFNVLADRDEKFLPFNNKWHERTRILMEINGETGEITQLLGRMSPNVPHCSFFFFVKYDIDNNGNFYISYQTDSIIYKYDSQYRLTGKFGYDGLNMNKNYTIIPYIKDVKVLSQIRDDEYNDNGYYTSLTLANGHIFRTYRTGGNNNQDRMQIYKNEELIGDVLIPEQFKIIGYIAPYYYTNIICDEDAERMTIYRFKL